MTKIYRSVKNSVVDQDNTQIFVIVPSNCSMKKAVQIAADTAQQMNKAPAAQIRDQALEDAAKAVDLRAEAFGIDMYGNKNAFHHSAAVIRAMKGAI